MKFKEIKDLCINPIKVEIVYTGKIKTLDIYYSNNEYDNAEIVKITNKAIVLKPPDKYASIREYKMKTKLDGSEEIMFLNDTWLPSIRIEGEYDDGHKCSSEIVIVNAKTLEEKIEVLKILYGGNNE